MKRRWISSCGSGTIIVSLAGLGSGSGNGLFTVSCAVCCSGPGCATAVSPAERRSGIGLDSQNNVWLLSLCSVIVGELQQTQHVVMTEVVSERCAPPERR